MTRELERHVRRLRESEPLPLVDRIPRPIRAAFWWLVVLVILAAMSGTFGKGGW